MLKCDFFTEPKGASAKLFFEKSALNNLSRTILKQSMESDLQAAIPSFI